MLLNLGIAAGPPVRTSLPSAAHPPRPPNLALRWTSRREQLRSSIAALLRGPAPPKRFQGGPFFRDCWIEPRFPRWAFLAAIAIETLLIAFPPPIWNIPLPRSTPREPAEQLTWYGPVDALPAIAPLPAARKPGPKEPGSNTETAASSEPVQNAFHARQSIIVAPLQRPTHPRQTLIQPLAPPAPPKILPPLPNILQIAAPALARPKPKLTAEQFKPLRPRAPEDRHAGADAPQVDVRRDLGSLNIAAKDTPQAPALPVSPMSAPRRAAPEAALSVAAPEVQIAGPAPASTLIALSAQPAPVAPPSEPPAGNLTSRIAVSPDGAVEARTGPTSAALPSAIRPTGNAASASLHGPDGIFIGAENGATQHALSGPSAGPGVEGKHAAILTQEGRSGASAAEKSSAQEPLLGSKRVYTLHVDMPNLTSVAGSWVLNFAEMDDPLSAAPPYLKSNDEIAAPVPVRKVDPKYPPELRLERVEGEVVLYAIIRKDGSVDSIQLVHGIDARLDANAMDALAQWKFQPAEKQGTPIDLEAVVHIPFRSRETVY